MKINFITYSFSLLISLALLMASVGCQPSPSEPSPTSTTDFPLPVPVLESPKNGALAVSCAPALKWENCGDELLYNLQVASSPNIIFPTIIKFGITQNYLNLTESLLNSSTYYWRVQVVSAMGTSEWSEIWSFTTIEAADMRVRVDAGQIIENMDPTLWANIGYESLYGVTVDERLQPFWEEIRQTGAIKYIRCHNLFSSGISRSWQEEARELLAAEDFYAELAGTYLTSSVYYGCRVYCGEDDNGNLELNFWHLDNVFDIFLSAGIKPIVECDYMPDALAEGKPIRNYGGGLVNTPKDYNKWRELVYQTVKHCIGRYGVEEVSSWYWESWNEPDLTNYFIDGIESGVSPTEVQIERFLKMYDFFADGAKAAEPNVRVGGPAIADHPEWLRLFLEHCADGTNYANGDKGAPLDFISWHGYGTLDQIEAKGHIRQDIIDNFPSFKDTPQLVDEWGRRGLELATYTNYEAVFLCALLDNALNTYGWRPDLLLRWSKLLTFDFNKGYKPLSIYTSGDLVPFPILNAYTMLSKMGDERVLSVNSHRYGTHSLASRTDNGVQIIVYRFDEDDTSNANPPVDIEVTVEGLTEISYQLKQYRIDSSHSNVTSVWDSMGKPDAMNTKQITRLIDDSRLQMLDSQSQLDTGAGKATIRINLPTNAITLIVLGEEKNMVFEPGQHISEVLKHEDMYKTAEQKLEDGDEQGAKIALEELIQDCAQEGLGWSGRNPHCLWGQKALFSLMKLEDRSGNHEFADAIRQRLLTMALNDTDRYILINARIEYLEEIGDIATANNLRGELKEVRLRIKGFIDWNVWSDS